MAAHRAISLGFAVCLGLAAAWFFVVGFSQPEPAPAHTPPHLLPKMPTHRPDGAGFPISWTLAADSPFAYWRFDAEYSPSTGKVYTLGGRQWNGKFDGSIWKFDPQTGVYQDTAVDMPVPVTNYQIARLTNAVLNEALVIFGGTTASGTVTTTVQVYYPASNSVATLPDPYPVAAVPGAVAVVNNRAYAFGGYGGGKVTHDTYIFDIMAAAGARWTKGPDLSLARTYIAAAVVDGVIYAMGGDTYGGGVLSAVTRTEKLNTASPTLAWDDDDVAEMPMACDENQAFGFSRGSPYDLAGKVVVAGCGQWPEEISESMAYDIATDTWDRAFPDLNIARRNFAGAFVPAGSAGTPPARMWVWNGRRVNDSTVLNSVEYYDVIVPYPVFLPLIRQ